MTGGVLSLSLGKPYPHLLPSSDGGVLDLFAGSSNQLLIALANPSTSEKWAVRKGRLKVGVVQKNTALMLMWVFHAKSGSPIITLDTSFDVRKIPAAKQDVPDKNNANKRLMVNITLVDSVTTTVHALRSITLPLDISDRLLSGVMDQLAAPEKARASLAEEARWSTVPLSMLYAQSGAQWAGK